MPRLHKCRGRDACYVLTAIRGAVVTCQLYACDYLVQGGLVLLMLLSQIRIIEGEK